MQYVACRVWPPVASTLHPKELHPVAAATVSDLIMKQKKVFWAAASHSGEGGQWVSAADACFLARGAKPSPLLVDVATRAGLFITDVPANIYEVTSNQLHNFKNVTSAQVAPLATLHCFCSFWIHLALLLLLVTVMQP